MTKKADKASSWDAVKHAHNLDGDAARLKAYYQSWADRYDADVGNERYSAPAYIADLLNHLPSNDDTMVDPENPEIAILDAGCGTGLVGKELANLGYRRIDGCDLSPKMVEKAEETGAYRSLRGNVDLSQRMDAYPDDQYDVTISCGVFTLGHVPPESLSELVRVTKKKGLVVVSTRKSYCERSGFESFCEQMQQEEKIRLIRHVSDGPYIEEEGAQYWVFAVTG